MRKKKQPKIEEIGIRELKSRASEVVRAVKEERAWYVITQRGKPAAIIVPLDAAPPEKSADEVWERLMKIGEELGKARRARWKFFLKCVDKGSIYAEIVMKKDG